MSGLEIADCPFCGRCVTLTAVSADCLIDFDNFQTDICGRKIVSATWKADAVLRHIVVAAIYFSTRNIVVTDANFVGAVETKVYFTAVDHPPAVSVLSDIVVAEINFAATKYPPSIFIFLYGVAVEIDFTADNAPPTIYIFGDTGVVKINFTATDIPPAVFVFLNGVTIEVNFTVFNTPPAVLVLAIVLSKVTLPLRTCHHAY